MLLVGEFHSLSKAMRQLFVDSRDRVSGTTTNFTIQLRDTLKVGPLNSFRIDNLRVPMVIPLIQSGVNDAFYFQAGGVTKRVGLLPGSYSGTDLATMIHTELSATHPEDTWVITYNNHTASLTIFCSDESFHAMTDADCAKVGIALPTFASTLFQNAFSYSTAGGTAITWSYCSMVAVDVMYLSSQKLSSQDTFGPGGAQDTVMAAVTTTDFASVMNENMAFDVWLGMQSLTTSTLDFQLRSRDYTILQNLPNISFTMTIK